MARVFFGLPTPDGALSHVASWSSAVGTELPDARMIAPANLHVTLNFIGEVSDEEVGRLSGICRELAAEAPPIPATLTGLGLLPSAARPRVVCLGVRDGAGELRTLADTLRLRLGGQGDRRFLAPAFLAPAFLAPAFLAHVTLARVRRVPRQTGERLCRVRLPPAHGTFRSLVLYQSVLQGGGATYRPLQTAELVGG